MGMGALERVSNCGRTCAVAHTYAVLCRAATCRAVLFCDVTAGGGIFMSVGDSCVTASASCYDLSIHSTSIRRNSAARGAGGGVYWTHSGVLRIQSCAAGYDAAYRTARLGPTELAAPRAPVEDRYLPCADWLPAAGGAGGGNGSTSTSFGPVIASTPFFVVVINGTDDHLLGVYPAGSPLDLEIQVHDYYGQLCVSSDNTTVAVVQGSAELQTAPPPAPAPPAAATIISSPPPALANATVSNGGFAACRDLPHTLLCAQSKVPPPLSMQSELLARRTACPCLGGSG